MNTVIIGTEEEKDLQELVSNIYLLVKEDQKYILSKIAQDRFVLINLETGNGHKPPTNNYSNLFCDIFKLVTSPVIITPCI